MTDQEWQDLGRRAVCRHWRWLPGMVDAATGLRVVKAGTDEDPRIGLGSLNDFILFHPGMMKGHHPDFRDAATLGCLLALVREGWPNVVIWVARDCAVDPLDDSEYLLDDVEGWTVCGGCGDDYVGCFGSGKTEADALVAALEAAP